jgi:CHAD domain-containing protein
MVYGERDASAQTVALSSVGRCIELRAAQFVELLGRLMNEDDVELVHDVRVTSRRLSQAIGPLRAVVPRTAVEGLKKWLREVRESLAPVRDADVLARVAVNLAESEGCKEAVRIAGTVADLLRQKRDVCLPETRQQLSGPQTLEHCRTLAGLIDESIRRTNDPDAFEGEMARRIGRRVRRRRGLFLELAERAAESRRPKRLHAARIAAKKLRYALELANDSGVLEAAAEIRTLCSIQDALGDLNDLFVLRERMAALSAQIRLSHSKGIGPLLSVVTRRQKRLIRRFEDRWPRMRRRIRKVRARKPAKRGLKLKVQRWSAPEGRPALAASC